MIEIDQKPLNVSQISDEQFSPAELKILYDIAGSNTLYSYQSYAQLTYELSIRLNVTRASVALLRSGASFETFARSRCNPRFWRRAPNGAFYINPGVSPSMAINDIFSNGRAYGFECATAIIIVFYKAVLDSIDTASFNQLFQGLYLYSWEHDSDLHLKTYEGHDFLIGDCVYFNNPDVDARRHPAWIGENAIILDDDMYFGHGIGIASSQQIIQTLNFKRKPYSNRSAYLENQITRLDFRFVRTFSRQTPVSSLSRAIRVDTDNRLSLY
ncbi:protein-glutamine gamma-glutamyltransferase [Shouchella shacheensis]|uniref:protein-glutamine gamma-glutamyltransferase n=1 Tax=Shouchella shacheensis TaxID=1649580 RepID=UPI00073FFDE2|nr:protein-glutamine gamma-glutamyltransferase [Shouchella shacheensis]